MVCLETGGLAIRAILESPTRAAPALFPLGKGVWLVADMAKVRWVRMPWPVSDVVRTVGVPKKRGACQFTLPVGTTKRR